jgi:hypothetical protein
MSDEFSDFPLNWMNKGNEYIAETPYGRAVIIEIEEPSTKKFNFGTHSYRLRLEYVNGEVENVHQIFDSLSMAEGQAYLSFQLYDAKHREQSELNDLLATLELCRRSLLSETKAENLKRIDRIELIVKKHFEQIP